MTNKTKLTQPTINENYQFHPTQLKGGDRYNHVISSLKAYNGGIIKNNPAGAMAKFEKLKLSPFIFMRGTADLMYRDLQGTDADKAIVLCNGDVHLENYGVMQADNGELIWGLNDFDESNFAPFTWDVKRGATSVILAAMDSMRKKKFTAGQAKKAARRFAASYLKAIKEKLKNKDFENAFNKKNSPAEIKQVIKEAAAVNRNKWLKKKLSRSKK